MSLGTSLLETWPQPSSVSLQPLPEGGLSSSCPPSGNSSLHPCRLPWKSTQVPTHKPLYSPLVVSFLAKLKVSESTPSRWVFQAQSCVLLCFKPYPTAQTLAQPLLTQPCQPLYCSWPDPGRHSPLPALQPRPTWEGRPHWRAGPLNQPHVRL